MEYLNGVGADEESLALQSYKAGQPLPDSIINAPILHIGLQLYLTAFYDLHAERWDHLKPIPWTAINRYCEAYGLDDEQSEALLKYIKAMDNQYLSKERRKHAADVKRSSRQSG